MSQGSCNSWLFSFTTHLLMTALPAIQEIVLSEVDLEVHPFNPVFTDDLSRLQDSLAAVGLLSAVEVGDKVSTGDLVCVLEAMKMQNSLPSPASGTVTAINFEPGASVAKDAVILVIGK